LANGVPLLADRRVGPFLEPRLQEGLQVPLFDLIEGLLGPLPEVPLEVAQMDTDGVTVRLGDVAEIAEVLLDGRRQRRRSPWRRPWGGRREGTAADYEVAGVDAFRDADQADREPVKGVLDAMHHGHGGLAVGGLE